jgi:hypothetical protein
MALLYFTRVSTCLSIAEVFAEASHDCLTRMLNGGWSGQALLDRALRVLFTVVGGYLMIDDTVVEKPYAQLLSEAGWVWSSKHRKVVYGVAVVLLVWSDGQIRIPIGFRVWKKGGPSKFELALELVSYARNHLKCKPQFVLFDSWYPSKALLKRISDYGWYFICQLKRNRCLEGVALHKYLRQPYWQAVGFLSGKIKVRVVRYRRKYYATNRLSLIAPQVRTLYQMRQEIEEVIRVVKSQLSLEGCQAGYRRSTEKQTHLPPQTQTHHIALCLVAYLIVERERFDQGMTWRQFKRHLILKRSQLPLPALERVRMAA